jgi:hypothetical protein
VRSAQKDAGPLAVDTLSRPWRVDTCHHSLLLAVLTLPGFQMLYVVQEEMADPTVDPAQMDHLLTRIEEGTAARSSWPCGQLARSPASSCSRLCA